MRTDLRVAREGRQLVVLFRTLRPAPRTAQAAGAAGAALLEIWLPQDADPPALLAAAKTGFRTRRAHRIAGPRIAPDLPSAPPFDRLGRADRARAALLLAVQAPAEGPPPAIAHPLLDRTSAQDGLMGEPASVWQTRLLAALATAPGPLDHHALGRLLRPPAEARGRWSPDLRRAMRAIRLRHPWAALDGWLRAAVETRLLAEAPGGGYVLGRALSAHDRLALAAAGAPR